MPKASTAESLHCCTKASTAAHASPLDSGAEDGGDTDADADADADFGTEQPGLGV
jgi:hypothetical protein